MLGCHELYEHVMSTSSWNEDSNSEDNETHITSPSTSVAVER